MGNNIVTLYVNEKKYVFSMGDAYGQVPQSETLLDTLRNRLGLTGAKKSCDQGACGCCTVIKDGDAVPSCMQLTVMAAILQPLRDLQTQKRENCQSCNRHF